jgi:phosphatidylserine decarboxylase
MSNVQNLEDTKYLQWADGMYVMLDDLLCDYEKALIENSLRRSVYFEEEFCEGYKREDCIGVRLSLADYDNHAFFFGVCIKLTRAQALYIATGDTDT